MVLLEFFPLVGVCVTFSRSTLIFTFSPCNWNCLSSCSINARSSAGSPRNCSTMLFGVLVGLAEEAFLWCGRRFPSTDLAALTKCMLTLTAITCGEDRANELRYTYKHYVHCSRRLLVHPQSDGFLSSSLFKAAADLLTCSVVCGSFIMCGSDRNSDLSAN